MNIEVEQNCDERPPRRGAVLAIEVDATARPYDLSLLAFGGHTPDKANKSLKRVRLRIEAEGADVYYHFAPETHADLAMTAKLAAAGTAAFANTYGSRIPQNDHVYVRIERGVDNFIIIQGGAGIVRIYAASAAEY